MNTTLIPDHINALIAATAGHFGLEPCALTGRRRDYATSYARNCTIWLAFNLGASCADIGKVLGRDKFSIKQTIEKVDRQMSRDGELVSDLHAIKSSFDLDTCGPDIAIDSPGYEHHVAAVARAYDEFQIARHTPRQGEALQRLLSKVFELTAAHAEYHMETE